MCVCVFKGAAVCRRGRTIIPECGTTALGTWRTEPPAENSHWESFALQRGKRLVCGYVLNSALRIFFSFSKVLIFFKTKTFQMWFMVPNEDRLK